MAEKKLPSDGITSVSTAARASSEAEPMVLVFIPPAEEAETGAKVDQTEHVTVNGVTTLIRRGEYIQVGVPVFMQLKTRYPNI